MGASIHRLDIPQDKTKYVLILNFHFTCGYVHLNKIEGRLKKNRIAPKPKPDGRLSLGPVYLESRLKYQPTFLLKKILKLSQNY